MRLFFLLVACVAACSASGCKSFADSEELHVLALSFKSHQNYVLFGKLSACPRQGGTLNGLRFVVTPKDNVNVVLLNNEVGDFMFSPATDFVGIVTFWYHVEDSVGASEPSAVTINIQPKTSQPSLDVAGHIIGLEDSDVELDIAIDNVDDGGLGDLSVAICNCAHDVTCDRESADCHCHLSLPDGWLIFDGDRQLSLEELNSLSPRDTDNLILRAAPSSAAEHCLAIHVIDPNNHEDPSKAKKQLNIHIHPLHSVILKPQPVVASTGPPAVTKPVPGPAPMNLTTEQGRPFLFYDLQVVDDDGIEGTFMVTVQLDQGGLLWVRQDLREDVVFIPTTAEIHPDEVSADRIYKLLDSFGTFRHGRRPFELEKTNNGVKLLRFIGSLEGINEVLSTLTFVPWCSDWPTPPSWPIPAKSWMNVPLDASEDLHRPAIWPQWYPRFWYPFPSHHWTWWPRVLPPWWISSVCSNWTSMVRMRVQEIPEAVTCQQTKEQIVAEWSANMTVISSGKAPKSLITDNHFSYFQPDSRSVNIDTVRMRSPQYDFGTNLRFNLSVLESNLASVVFPLTDLNYTECNTVERCNEQLMNIKVTFKDGVQDVCLVSVQIDMHKNDSDVLLDRLVVWAVNTTRQCADITATHSDFELIPKDDIMSVRQGSVNNPLHLLANIEHEGADLPGILHVILYAKHGSITMKVQDGLRIYSDHMGQHEEISSYLCLAGPTSMVIEALSTARFTPFSPLFGEMVVTMDYRMPSTAAKLLYGQASPFRRVLIPIDVQGGIEPYMPVVVYPQEMCVTETASLTINMTTILRRFREDEGVTYYLTPGIGSLQLDTSDKGLYECPQLDQDSLGICADFCTSHPECPDSFLCCSNGCGHICTQGELKANLQLLSTGQVTMTGHTHDINQVILRNAIRYVPASCSGREMDSYTDSLSIGVIPSRNPEGDSVRVNIPIHVDCTVETLSVAPQEQVDNCEWIEWTPCTIEGSICGLGSQNRYQVCNSENIIETRPCQNCSCAPVPVTLLDPLDDMEGCSSQVAVLQCPEGCSKIYYRTQIVSFLCQPQSGEEGVASKDMAAREASVKVHLSCECDSCTRYHTAG